MAAYLVLHVGESSPLCLEVHDAEPTPKKVELLSELVFRQVGENKVLKFPTAGGYSIIQLSQVAFIEVLENAGAYQVYAQISVENLR